MACTVGSATQVSVHKPASTIFFLPDFSMAATKFASSQEFIELRSMGVTPGNAARICGQVLPLKALVSTEDRTAGTPNTWEALHNITLLLMTVCRSKLDTPNSICGCR